jgi:hypothetical protein
MTGPSYPAARTVADLIQRRISENTTAYQEADDAPRPDGVAIEEIVSVAFWASLRREETRAPKISLAFLPPEQSVSPLTFEKRLPLEPGMLARLAPAAERPGIHLGVWWYDNRLCVWGTTRWLPVWCFVLEVVGPGLLVVKYRRADPAMKFANVAVLEGSDVKLLRQGEDIITEGPPVLTSLLEFYASAGSKESDNILVRLGISMQAHGRGGSLLVVPRDTDEWRQSIVQPMTYSVVPPHSEIGLDNSPEALRSAVDALAGLTAVDGATVISDRFAVLAFGVKIMRRDGARRVEEILLTEPVENAPEKFVDPSQWGGTRHLSCAQFVHDQQDAIALVASQDSRFTVFAWSPARKSVHAHRLESLLM